MANEANGVRRMAIQLKSDGWDEKYIVSLNNIADNLESLIAGKDAETKAATEEVAKYQARSDELSLLLDAEQQARVQLIERYDKLAERAQSMERMMERMQPLEGVVPS